METGRPDKQSSFLHDLKLRSIKLLNIVLMTIPFAAAWYLVLRNNIVSPYYMRGNWLIIFIYFMLYSILGRTYDAFLVSYNQISEMVYSQCLAAFLAGFFLYIITWLLAQHLPNISLFLLVFLAQVLISILWSYAAHQWYFRTFKPKRTFIVWDMRKGMTNLIQEYGLSRKFQVVGNCRASECVADLDQLNGMEAVFLTGVHSHDRNTIIKYCVEHHITTFIIPRIGDVMMSGAKQMHMFHLPILRLDRYSPTPEYLFLKRLFDCVFAVIGLVVLSPVLLVVAAAVKRYDGGPVLYRQCRLTKDGKKFDVLKFRSMRVDAEKDGVARLSTGDADPRITPVGRVLRRFRLDELPQLFNILKGDMSFVGPRPERPEIAAEYEKELPEFHLRLQAKCGLTGYAQVFGKYNTTPYDKLQMDLMYIATPSLAMDIRIIFATIKILFLPESTEGVGNNVVKTRSMKKALKTRGLKLLHLAISIVLFVFCWELFYYNVYTEAHHRHANLILYCLYAVLLFLMNRTYESYSLGYRKASDNTYSQTLADVITAGVIWTVSLLMYMRWTNPLPLIGLCAGQLLWNMGWSVFAKKAYDSLHMQKRTAVIYVDDEDLQRLEEVGQLEHKFNVQKYVKDPQDYKELEKEIDGFEAIVVSGVNATLRNGLAKYCIETGVLGYFAPHVGDIIMQGSRHMRKAPFTTDRKAELPSLRSVAEELGTTVIRTRKLLITARYFISPTASTVQRMKSAGKSIEEIGAELKLKPAAVYGYLPYESLAYNLPETTSNADRHKRYRATKKLKAAVDTGSIEKISATLWQCVCVFSGYPFTTSGRGSRSGVEYTYQVSRKGGSGGRHYDGHSIPGYGNEIWLTVNGEKKEKSISRSSVELGFRKYLEVLEKEGTVTGPKKLGVFGASYLLPLFQRFYKP